MGRTVPTYRNVLEELILDWKDFRRALRTHERQMFDRLMEKARKHSSAASYGPKLNPAESMFMSILLEQEKEIHELRRKLRDENEGLDP
jgi:selenocysteine lyase/cysteine desulfurase